MTTATGSSGSSGRLAGRLALITGATRGIGRAVALALAQEGAHLILTGRTSGALEEVDDEIRALQKSHGAKPEGATLITLNLKHAEKIDALGPTLFGRFGKLDILVASAGVLGPLSPLGHIQNEGFLETIDINLTANWRLIRSLDPLLKASDAGRAVFATSGAAGAKNAYWGPYAVSKAGLEALVKTYALECAETSVRANLISPGPIRTRMRAKAFPGEDPMTLKTPEDIAPTFVRFCLPSTTDNGVIYEFANGRVRASG
jgi:NAD(P)-dependent dehydrogenase (short-subunit alcohol dehydrogenase family)